MARLGVMGGRMLPFGCAGRGRVSSVNAEPLTLANFFDGELVKRKTDFHEWLGVRGGVNWEGEKDADWETLEWNADGGMIKQCSRRMERAVKRENV